MGGCVLGRALVSAALSLSSVSCVTLAPSRPEPAVLRTIELLPCRLAKSTDSVLCGRHAVFENREAQAGRRITLNIVVLPALGPTRVADPVFFLVGGPGIGAASVVTGDMARS